MTHQLPTNETYAELQHAYEFFNARLFQNRLPNCLITLQREKRTYGYFSSGRFVGRKTGERTDEIALNPSYFGIRTIEESLSTLVHEMTHLDQQHNGNPGRGRYHNKEWARSMIAIGLHPSDTGKEGGKMTGDCMSHYIVAGGLFETACCELMTAKFTLSWVDRFPPIKKPVVSLGVNGLTGGSDEGEDGEDEDGLEDEFSGSLVFPPDEGKQTRHKYTCPHCNNNTWGKKDLNILCGNCDGAPRYIPA